MYNNRKNLSQKDGQRTKTIKHRTLGHTGHFEMTWQ